jgi:hypothetical protein
MPYADLTILVGRWVLGKKESKARRYGRTRHSQADSHGVAKSQSEELSPDFSPVKKNKAALYGIRAVSPNSYAKGEARPYGNTVYNRTNGISATGASRSGGKI